MEIKNKPAQRESFDMAKHKAVQAEAARLRELLNEYHDYLDEHFPESGYCGSAINNFIHHKSLTHT